MPIYRLDHRHVFPPVHRAEPDGLLAVGGDLSVPRLLAAYRAGIFPWYDEGDPILWWSPDPRFVLFPARLKVSASMRRIMRSGRFRLTFDAAFREVIGHCRRVARKGQEGTWLVPAMVEAYCRLHAAGHAHSVEAWDGDRLVGGLYGVRLGAVFFGESMFALASNASKAALIALVERLVATGCLLIDCQVYSDHLCRLGAEEITRPRFLSLLEEGLRTQTSGLGTS